MPPPAQVLLVGFAGFSLAYWAQGRGFAYHAYPARALAFTGFAYAAALAVSAVAKLDIPVARWVRLAMSFCLLAVSLNFTRLWTDPVITWLARFNMETGDRGSMRSELIARINAVVPRGGFVYAFSSHPFPAFPTLSYTEAEYGSPLVAQFAIPALLASKRSHDPARLAAIEAVVRSQREQVLADFTRHAPVMVLIETSVERLAMRGRNFDDVAFYSADPRFAAIWSHYVEAEPVNTVRVFMRRD
jgi:hypothetical protein